MKRQFFCLLVLVSFASGAVAQVTDTSTVERALRKNIEYLASNKLEGRRTGEPGSAAAAAYVSDQFAQLRLKPGTTKNGKPTYLQSFPYVTGVEMAKTGNEFALELTGSDGRRIKVENMLPAKPVGFSPSGSVTGARIDYAGFGISSADPKFDDYKWDDRDLDVKGDVVLVFDGTPDNDNPHSPFQKFDLRTKALIAKGKGAVGMLVITREQKFEDDKLTRLGYDQTLGEAALPTFVISRNTAQNILGVTEKDLVSIESLTASKKDTSLKVHVGFRDTKPVVSFKVSLVKTRASAYNVIGILPGRDRVLKNEAIVIGAHYDHLGHGGQGSLAANSTDIHHGADDNASGTAAIIELARQVSAEKKNKRTIIFIAFSGEEEGLIGSKYYTNDPVFPLDKTVAMINLDMVGRLKDDKLDIGGMGTASEWNQIVKRNNDIMFDSMDGYGVGQKFTLALNEDGLGPSDHSSFYLKKIPVLFFFTGTHVDYHKPSDTADKINYAGEAKVIAYVGSLVRAIDQNPIRPTYTLAKSSGMGGGRSGFNISLGTIPSYADSSDGLILDGVRDNSPASHAGLKGGDKVVRLAGKEIRNVMDYTYVLGEMRADVEYEVVVVRGAERLTFKITPVKR